MLDCAIQAWTLEQLGIPLRQVILAHINNAFVYAGDGHYDGLFTEVDVTEPAQGHFDRVSALIDLARSTLDGPEPSIDVGPHCSAPYSCSFFDHCLPTQGEYPVLDLGGSSARNFELIRAGFRDLHNVPEDQLSNGRQRRIWEYTRQGRPFLGPGLRQFVGALDYPRYYLDFETISFAVPIWAGTRPYEQLPFQWSCHIDNHDGELAHEAFLDLSGAPPMRACAERLIAALSSEGPILVYTSFEQQVISGLATRYPDLAAPLDRIRERLADLYRITASDYCHPAMHGSWSLKAVLPTIAPELSYASLGEIQDGGAAQAA